MSTIFPEYMVGHLEQQRTSKYYLPDYMAGHLEYQRTSSVFSEYRYMAIHLE